MRVVSFYRQMFFIDCNYIQMCLLQDKTNTFAPKLKMSNFSHVGEKVNFFYFFLCGYIRIFLSIQNQKESKSVFYICFRSSVSLWSNMGNLLYNGFLVLIYLLVFLLPRFFSQFFVISCENE